MQTLIVTGSSGLIGAHLVRALSAQHRVVSVSRHAATDLPASVEHISLDLATDWSADILPARCDAVIHLAQSENFRNFPEQAEEVFQVNTASTLRLLDYARRAGAQRFVLASSGGIYGSGDQEFSEDAEIRSRGDLGFYLGTKLCSEVIAESYTPFMRVIALRFFFVYGRNQRASMLVPRLVRSVAEGRPITLQGPDGLRLNPVHVSDAVRAVEASLMLEESQKINVGGPEILTLRQISETIGYELGRAPHFEAKADVTPNNLVGDIRKMSAMLGVPTIRFADGVRELCREVASL